MTAYWPNGSLSIPRVTSEFDAARKNPVTGIVQPHNGIDLIGWVDNCSPVDGTVVFAGYNGGAGNEVRIRADGPTAFHVGDCFRILHNASLYVRTGDRVSARQAVGKMGTTGQSTGIHCHFETHEFRLWNYVNPRDFMARANAGGTPAGGGATPLPKKEEEEDMGFVQVKDDRGNFAIVGPNGVRQIGNEASLRGADKILRALYDGKKPEAFLSGEEWDAGTLDAFRGNAPTKTLIIFSHPNDAGQQVYWLANFENATKAKIANGTQLDFYRAMGIPEYVNQSETIVHGFAEIRPNA